MMSDKSIHKQTQKRIQRCVEKLSKKHDARSTSYLIKYAEEMDMSDGDSFGSFIVAGVPYEVKYIFDTWQIALHPFLQPPSCTAAPPAVQYAIQKKLEALHVLQPNNPALLKIWESNYDWNEVAAAQNNHYVRGILISERAVFVKKFKIQIKPYEKNS